MHQAVTDTSAVPGHCSGKEERGAFNLLCLQGMPDSKPTASVICYGISLLKEYLSLRGAAQPTPLPSPSGTA